LDDDNQDERHFEVKKQWNLIKKAYEHEGNKHGLLITAYVDAFNILDADCLLKPD
jgi:hypothetical protein